MLRRRRPGGSSARIPRGEAAHWTARAAPPNRSSLVRNDWQALVSRADGTNAFMAKDTDAKAEASLSPIGRHYLAGLLHQNVPIVCATGNEDQIAAGFDELCTLPPTISG